MTVIFNLKDQIDIILHYLSNCTMFPTQIVESVHSEVCDRAHT